MTPHTDPHAETDSTDTTDDPQLDIRVPIELDEPRRIMWQEVVAEYGRERAFALLAANLTDPAHSVITAVYDNPDDFRDAARIANGEPVEDAE